MREHEDADAITTQLAAWRAQGLHERDPARFHRIEALSRRAQAFSGDVRRVLDQRLGVLMGDFSKGLDSAKVASHAPAAPNAAASPLVALTASMAQRPGAGERSAASARLRTTKPSTTSTASATSTTSTAATSATSARPPRTASKADGSASLPTRPAAPSAPSPVAITPTVIATDDAFEDLDVLEYFRETWSKLSTDGNLRQSLAQVPENAGPLNSSHLVHRALSLMHDVSPDYLRHFLRHADALSWLEDMEATGVFGNKAAARSAAPAKPSRAKAR
ncbi:hypothetical protein AB870_07625 [Pandoraea faecigallinarum]|uniref:DUF2894 domain-containing protein n=1 Tax=Pandoraea faecigallinarum TaxID=656179 RepID=A0A0H3WTR8_9BURK|nr:DUF2894 domain-containing protein [Pandoraea faecigallinarum]AKM29998.1 hypothetical protein AB870_07625 [Pandoraea faecigallinarum]